MCTASPQWRTGTLLGGTAFIDFAVILQLGDRLAMDGLDEYKRAFSVMEPSSRSL